MHRRVGQQAGGADHADYGEAEAGDQKSGRKANHGTRHDLLIRCGKAEEITQLCANGPSPLQSHLTAAVEEAFVPKLLTEGKLRQVKLDAAMTRIPASSRRKYISQVLK